MTEEEISLLLAVMNPMLDDPLAYYEEFVVEDEEKKMKLRELHRRRLLGTHRELKHGRTPNSPTNASALNLNKKCATNNRILLNSQLQPSNQ
jgi:hypothetical protein